jgi:peptide deformylase
MNRTALKLRFYPEVILRRKTQPVKKFDEELHRILKEMAQIMYTNKGVGLAANQVGLDLSLLVADAGDKLYKLVNPKIILKQGKEIMEEGCLSIPGICVKVKRAKKIKVQAQDEYGKPLIIETEGLLSRILQHEIDHLQGKLIIDYVGFFKRILLKIRLKSK